MDRPDTDFSAGRRAVMIGGAAAALMPAAGLAQPGEMDAIRKAVTAGHVASVKRIQDWIANPTIAAEKLNVDGGADYMMRRALRARPWPMWISSTKSGGRRKSSEDTCKMPSWMSLPLPMH